MVEAEEPLCKLCSYPAGMHAQMHHQFVAEGEDPGAAIKQPRKKDEKKPETPRPQLIIAPAPDIILRQLLMKKGLITREEVEEVERELAISQAPRLFADPPPDSRGGEDRSRSGPQ